MKLLAVGSLLVAACAAAPATTVTVSYDQGYDDASRSLDVVSCSDGQNGLITKYGWKTQGNVAGFPNIGGAFTVAGWNSPQCGSCYTLSYNGRSINVLAVDHAAQGFNIALSAMNKLTNGNAVQLGRIDATYVAAPAKACGLS